MKVDPNSLSKVAPTLAELKKLPMEQKCCLLLARLAMIGRHDSALNKHNLMLGGDPYGLANGYPKGEKRAVREHLLGAPWTKLVNEGFLVDLSGQGFHKLSDEGREYLERDEVATPAPKQSVVNPASSSAAPRVFLSYSWEGPEHKEWVRRFAERLQGESGVEVTFDRWHLSPGDDKLRFMEQGVAKNDFVIVICSPSYAQRANERQGGVGYESTVVTSELAEHMGTNKFIPVLRKGTWADALPIYLKSRMGVNLSDEPYSEEEYLNLLRVLHREPMPPPPIGGKPNFRNLPNTGKSTQRTENIYRAQLGSGTRTDHFLADVISELEDNLDKARRPQTGEAYRQPTDKIWLENRNKIDLPSELRGQLKSAYHNISAWADIVRTGIHPNLGSMQLNLLASGLAMSLPWLIEQLRKVQPRHNELEQRVAGAPAGAKGYEMTAPPTATPCLTSILAGLFRAAEGQVCLTLTDINGNTDFDTVRCQVSDTSVNPNRQVPNDSLTTKSWCFTLVAHKTYGVQLIFVQNPAIGSKAHLAACGVKLMSIDGTNHIQTWAVQS